MAAATAHIDAVITGQVLRVRSLSSRLAFADVKLVGDEPGVGEVDFSRLCALLDELGYEGHVGMEYKPSTSTTVQSLAGWGEAHGLLVR